MRYACPWLKIFIKITLHICKNDRGELFLQFVTEIPLYVSSWIVTALRGDSEIDYQL